jgi:uncharacterized protein YbjQ (UPF0145 family)
MTVSRTVQQETELPVFMGTVGLPPNLTVIKMAPLMSVGVTHNYTQTSNGLGDAIANARSEAVRRLGEAAVEAGYDAVVGVGITQAVDSAIRVVMAAAYGTPVNTRRSGPVDC